jgi:cobalamin biosynthesis Mg chelatase CobN
MSMRAVSIRAAIVVLCVGAIAAHVVMDNSAARPVAAQAPVIGPTSTAAAETAVVGLTAIAATDAPTPPAPTLPPPPTPVLTPTPPPGLRPTPTGTPLSVSTLGAGGLASSGSAAAGVARPLPATAGSTSSSSAWPVIGVLIVVAAVVAAGIVWTRRARRPGGH